ncbi:MAG: hypothetical protein IJY45_00835, partial [Tidjanibacter sp.]|nr:hypothetical protein [Tidjanibacter sp.]
VVEAYVHYAREDAGVCRPRGLWGERLQLFEWVDDLGLEELEHDFGLADFIKANFARDVEHTAESAAQLN